MQRIVLVILLAVTLIAVTSTTAQPFGNYVCRYSASYRQSVTQRNSHASSYRTCTGGSWFRRKRCSTRYRLGYTYSVGFETRYRNALRCCSGYTEFANECIKQCTPSCATGWCNNDKGVCQCPRGRTGPTCSSDINECSNGNGGCQHTCHNTAGSYYCSCNNGFRLGSDGKKCIETSTHCSSPQVPLPPQVGCVGVTKSGRNLAVSWSAVAIPSYNISYVVVYSTDSGTKTDPPTDVVEKSGIKDTSTTLTGLQLGATYYVWVATKIIGTGVQGPYSQRAVVGENSCVDCTRPGIVSGITAAELNEIARVAAPILEREVSKFSIPDVGGSVSLRNIQLESFHIRNLRITPSSSGITLSATISAGVDLDWKYCKRILFIKLCDDGNADVDVTASLRSTLKILVSNGRYSFTAEGTSVSVSNLDIDIGGTWLSIVYNFLASIFNGNLKRRLSSTLTSQLSTLIRKHGSEAIGSFPKTLRAHDNYNIDFTLQSTPRTHSSYVSTSFKGVFLKTASPFPPPICPKVNLPGIPPAFPHCAYYFYISDFFANTMLYTLYHDNVFHFDKIIPLSSLKLFHVPQGDPSDHEALRVVIRAKNVPSLIFNSGSLTLHFSASLKAYYRGRLFDDRNCSINLDDIIATLSLSIKTRSGKHFVTASFSELSVQTSDELCSCFGLDTSVLPPVINALAKIIVLPKLNEYGAVGIPLPELDHIDLHHPMIHLKPGYATCCFDLDYNP